MIKTEKEKAHKQPILSLDQFILYLQESNPEVTSVRADIITEYCDAQGREVRPSEKQWNLLCELLSENTNLKSLFIYTFYRNDHTRHTFSDKYFAQFCNALAKNTTLKVFEIHSYGFSKQQWRMFSEIVVAKNSSLKAVSLMSSYLNSNTVDEWKAFAEAFRVNKTITELDLSECRMNYYGKMDPDSWEIFCQTIKDSKSLLRFDFLYKYIDSTYFDYQKLLDAYQNNPYLFSFNFNWDSYGHEVLKIVDGFKVENHARQSYLHQSNLLLAQVLYSKKIPSRLGEYILSFISPTTALIKQLGKELEEHRNKVENARKTEVLIKDTTVRLRQNDPTLTELDLSGLDLTTLQVKVWFDFCQALEQHNYLEKLSLQSAILPVINPFKWNWFWLAIEKQKSLQILNLQGTLSQSLKVFQNITNMITDRRQKPELFFRVNSLGDALRRNSSITTLDLSSNGIFFKHISYILYYTDDYKDYRDSGCFWDKTFSNRTLGKIDLSSNAFDDSEIYQICKSLESNKTLFQLDAKNLTIYVHEEPASFEQYSKSGYYSTSSELEKKFTALINRLAKENSEASEHRKEIRRQELHKHREEMQRQATMLQSKGYQPIFDDIRGLNCFSQNIEFEIEEEAPPHKNKDKGKGDAKALSKTAVLFRSLFSRR